MFGKIAVLATVVTVASSTVVFAAGNSTAAKGMAAAAPTGLFDYPGASVARTLKGGWGNVGSGLLPTGVVAKPKR